jgi:putative flippase GtrA
MIRPGLRSGEQTAEAARFLIVGAVGFLIDTAVTYAAIHLAGIGPYLARLPAFLVAVTCVWAMNRSFTFRMGRDGANVREWTRFVGVYVGGALINFAVYSVVVWTGPPHVLLPGIGIAIGQAVAIFWNYFGARRLVFRHQSR